MSELEKLLIELEMLLSSNNSAICKSLQNGLPIEYITSLLSTLDISDSKISTLYHWKNGIQYNSQWVAGELDLFSFGVILSLEDMLQHREILIKSIRLKALLLPIFVSGAGDYILYQANANDKNFGRLLIYAPNLLLSATPELIYDSLESCFQTICECYRSGAYKITEGGTLEIDYDMEEEISKRLNPIAEYWK
jgi:hypothetical protein